MDTLMKLSTGAKLALGGLALAFIDSFLPWQTAGPFSINEWHGIGVLAVLIGIVLLVWEALPLFGERPAIGTLNPRLISLVLAAAFVLFTLIRALTTYPGWSHGWGAWVGLILSIAVAAGIGMQAQAEGFQMPKMKAPVANVSTTAETSMPAPPPAPPAPDAPAAPSPPADEPSSGDVSEHS